MTADGLETITGACFEQESNKEVSTNTLSVLRAALEYIIFSSASTSTIASKNIVESSSIRLEDEQQPDIPPDESTRGAVALELLDELLSMWNKIAK